MNNWGNDFSMPPNQYGMSAMTPMNPLMGAGANMMQPLMPPMCMISDIGTVNATAPAGMQQQLIGPVMPEGLAETRNDDVQLMNDLELQSQNVEQLQQNVQTKVSNQGGSRERKNKRDQDHERDHSRRRSRSSSRFDRSDRGDRSRSDRGDRSSRSDRNDRSRRERSSKWSKPDNQESTRQSSLAVANNMMIPGMMQFNMLNNTMMPQQSIEMGNMQQTMGNMGNMGNMQNMMPAMNMMQNIMPNMMDPMMMMNQQLPIPNQPMFLANCVLLPPIPGASVPKRRDKPSGCRTIFVGGLPSGISEDVVHEIFQRFGGVDDIKLHRQVCHVRFENHPSVEQSFFLSGYRFKLHDQADAEATTLFIDYALNRDDQNEFERYKRLREPTPPRIEPFTAANLTAITDKIKSDEDFVEAAPTLLGWLERGECTKKNANTFYSLIQATNNQVRRLFNEKMTLDDEFQGLKSSLKEKFAKVILQFEQVAKILTMAKHQRVSDHFTKQQRRNIEMWLKMTEEMENIKEEFNSCFDDEDADRPARSNTLQEKYEELKKEKENLMFELEGYRNEAHLAKDEAERKFEKFRAQFIAQQALQNPGKQIYPPLPAAPISNHVDMQRSMKPEPPPPTPDDLKMARGGVAVPQTDAKLISMLTAFLLVHPLGATQDYLVSYVRSMMPNVTQSAVNQVLQNHTDVFHRKTKGVGPSIEHRWEYVLFHQIKQEY